MSRLVRDVKAVIQAGGPATGMSIARQLGAEPRELVGALREAVARNILVEKNGHYDLHRCEKEPARVTWRWVEGNTIPSWVRELAQGPVTCESVDVIAEIAKDKQMQGWPPFVLASIDVRLSHFKCLSTSETVDRYVLRYMPVDTRALSEAEQEKADE